MTTSPPQRPQHLDALTGVRGIAAWLVVLFHARVLLRHTLPGWAMAAAAKGYLAVDLFFMLSGFVLWYNYAGRLRGSGARGVADFWWKRLARIWPLHAVILALFVLLAGVLAAHGKQNPNYPFAELPLHVLLIQNWGLTPALAWNDPAWSISCEMGAYLAFPLIVMATGPWAGRRAAGFMTAAGAVALLVAIWGLFALAGASRLGADVPRLGLGRCLLEFTLGTLLCGVWGRWRAARLAGPLAGLACAAALAVGIGVDAPETAYVPLAFAALILMLALWQGPLTRALAARLPCYLGEISYSTYLSHYLLITLFKLAFVPVRAGQAPMIDWEQLGAYLLIVLAASVALYHGVEKPAQRWLNAASPLRRGQRKPRHRAGQGPTHIRLLGRASRP